MTTKPPAEPMHFATPADFRRWLARHHERETELWVGFHKKATGRPSITWPEAVDEALCVGWIDGIRRSLGDDRYMIRFTPRKPTSTWSAVNQRRMAVLITEGRVQPAGRAAWEKRKAERSGTYSYENRHAAALDAESERQFRANAAAWRWFERQPAGYRKTTIWWVISAKKPETRTRRLQQLIAHSAAGELLPAFRPRR